MSIDIIAKQLFSSTSFSVQKLRPLNADLVTKVALVILLVVLAEGIRYCLKLGAGYCLGWAKNYSIEKEKGYWSNRLFALFQNRYALCNLGEIFADRQDPQAQKQAIHFFQKAVFQGSISAHVQLGWIYLKKDNSEEMIPKGLALYKMAADLGSVDAMMRLGRRYESGIDVEQNLETAYLWYCKAAERGDPEALFKLGLIHQEREETDRAWFYFVKAAENGSPEAHYQLGCFFAAGIGTLADLWQAQHYFQKAAALGDAQGFIGMGMLALDQSLGRKISPLALECFKKAADHGYPEGYIHLARLYREGTWVEKNLYLSLRYLQAAEECKKRSTGSLMTTTLQQIAAPPQRIGRRRSST